MKDIFDIDYRETVRRVVKKQLKEQYGIKIPKDKPSKQLSQDEDQENGGVFGIPLENVPSINIGEDNFFPIPRFIVDAVLHLKDHLQTEGLFRKSGSLGRQKLLRKQINKGLVCDFETMQPHDMASLLKQFFRELPDPLLTNALYSSFMKTLSLVSENERTSALLLLCMLLPDENLRVLRYLTHFVQEVAQHSQETKMSLSNLAIVLTPNIMFSTKDKNNEKGLKEQTQVVDCVFQNGQKLGIVPDDILEKLNEIDYDVAGCASSSGEEIENNTERIGRSRHRSRRHRRRSRSISGFVMGLGKKIRQTNSKSGHDDSVIHLRHQRSKSEKSISTMKADSELYMGTPIMKDTGRLDGLHLFSEQVLDKSNRSRSLKRKQWDAGSDTASDAVRSPKLPPRQGTCQTITSPKLVTMSTQYMMTPRRNLQAIKNNTESLGCSPLARLPPIDVRRLNSLKGHKADTDWRSFTNTPTNQPSIPDRSDYNDTVSSLCQDESVFNTPEHVSHPASSTPHDRKPSTPYSITPKLDFRTVKAWRQLGNENVPSENRFFNPIYTETVDY